MKYRTGLVVGKFAPLTRGHEALIEHALSQCDNVIILSYTSADYGKYSDPDLREKWLTRFVNSRWDRKLAQIVVLRPHRFFPMDEDTEEHHRLFCADYLFNKMHTTVQAVFSSEPYGVGFAEYLQSYFNRKLNTNMTVTAETFDIERKVVPVSATMVREMGIDAAFKANMISSHVYAYLMPKVLILGGESSGKTTLVKALAEKIGTSYVPEYGRRLWDERNGNLFYEDMEQIGKEQLHSEFVAAHRANQVLICDTSPLTTFFYSNEMFHTVSPGLRDMAINSEYDAIYICDYDIPFEQDGTRRDSDFRKKAHDFYVKFCGVPPYAIIVRGTVEERVSQVIADLKEKGFV